MADVEYKFIDNTVLADEVIGHANISSISDGTLRGAVKKINTDLDGVKEHLGDVDISEIGDSVTDSISKLNTSLGGVNENLEYVNKSLTTNILKPNLTSDTINGITCTDNGDGTYTFNGTATGGNSIFGLIPSNSSYATLKKGVTYKFIGCPIGGAVFTKYWMYCNEDNSDSEKCYNDEGNGVIFTCKTDNNSNKNNIGIFFNQGVTVSNLTFKPMITTNLNATLDDFVAFTGSTGKLNSDVAKLESEVNSSLGNVTNILKSTLQSSVVDTVTCTKNNDGTYTLSTSNPTTTASGFTLGTIDVKKGKAYKIVGCPKGGGESKYRLWTISSTAFPLGHRLQDTGDGTVMTALADETVRVIIEIGANQSFSNLVFKPMLCTNQNAQYSDFVQYTGSTGKLNSDVAEINNSLELTTATATINTTNCSSGEVKAYKVGKMVVVSGAVIPKVSGNDLQIGILPIKPIVNFTFPANVYSNGATTTGSINTGGAMIMHFPITGKAFAFNFIFITND